MMSGATCLTQAPSELYWSYITVNGTIQWLDSPCEEGEECPPCVAPAIVTSDKTYYLSSSNQEVRDFLDRIEVAPIPAIYLLPLQARASGTPYTKGSFDFLVVNDIDDLYVEYFSDQLTRLNSLCDEWNVLEHLAAIGPDYESFSTLHFRLTTDTIINATRYVKLEQDGIYKGAMREGTNADIYYVPNHSTNEYLLYAFNAQVGDSLENLWFGANEIDRFIIKSATVVNIESTTPRKFTIGFEWQSIYSYAAINDTSEIMYAELVWLEGVGFQVGGPLSYECPFDCAGGPGLLTLCAYKNGEKVYADPYWNEKVGCEYNRHTLPSLCDEWNVWHDSFFSFLFSQLFKYRLTTDTIINGQRYIKVVSVNDNYYHGAFREDNNANIYYIPYGLTHEYLLYAFNAQVGDQLSNVWIGGVPEDYPNGLTVTVEAIQETNPRTFVLSTTDLEGNSVYTTWIEGIGFSERPYEVAEYRLSPIDDGVYTLLCAYKNGKHIYTSDKGEQYGCEHDRDPNSTRADTIPLYTRDDSGSSTVDPVDPNQVIATLKGDELTIRESSGEEIMMALSLSEGDASVPAFNRVQRTQSFQNELTVTLTEEGLYRLELSNPSWEYTIYGTFRYPQRHDAIDQTLAVPAAQKILRNGQLLIRIGDKVYTVHGTEVGE